MATLEEQLRQVKAEAQTVAGSVETLAQAEQAGLEVTPETTVQEAEVFQPASILKGDDLTPSPTIDPQVPEEPDTSINVPDLDLGEKQQEAQDLSDEILQLQEATLGESIFRASESERLGVSDLRTQQEDLASEFEALKLQSQALENQKTLAGERIQQESAGRGRTVAGAAPLTAAAKRKLTLKRADIASQSLMVAAEFNITQGRLGTAERLIDEAVEKKFGPIKEEIAVKKSNLQLIIDSPAFDAEDKKRAEEQKKVEDANEREVEIQEDNYEKITDTLFEATENGAPPDIRRQIKALLEDPTVENAVQAVAILAPYLAKADVSGRQTTFTIQTDEGTEDVGPFDAARSIAQANPGASDAELSLAIRENVVDANGNSVLSVGEVNDIIEEMRGTPEGQKATLRNAFTPFRDAGMSRKDVEAQWREQNKWPDNLDLPQGVTDILDELYPETTKEGGRVGGFLRHTIRGPGF